MGSQALFDLAVFAAVEGDEPDATAGLETVRGDSKQLRETAEFVVDQDPQRLERSGSRVRYAMTRGGGIMGCGLFACVDEAVLPGTG